MNVADLSLDFPAARKKDSRGGGSERNTLMPNMESWSELSQDLRLADVAVLTFACDQPATLERLHTFWLPELRRLEKVRIPVIVVGCKLDAQGDATQVHKVFYYVQNAVFHPLSPLLDQESLNVKPQCLRALESISILCDHDKDGAQVKCFDGPLLQTTEIVDFKRSIKETLPEGVDDRGLTLTGFLGLFALSIGNGDLETSWKILRKFGYDNDLQLKDDLLPLDLNSRNEVPYVDAAKTTTFGGLPLHKFLSKILKCS
ncbi:hypothetical protein Sjap_006608 [Stephania japonica]|uniref:EF hand associated type-2 domain-containing protein n=1 Tax=Stephania japonica TaxID=461633 RepID=A0AAP0K7B6_9MAGN